MKLVWLMVVALLVLFVLSRTPIGAQLFVWNGTIVGQRD